MAVLGQRPLPPIWPHPKSGGPFFPPLAIATLVNGQYQNNPDALAVLSDQRDKTALSGRAQLTLPDGPLVLIGRGRGDPTGVTLGGLPLLITLLGLDAAPPELPRGFFPWTARIDGGAVLELDLKAFKISQLQVRPR